MSRDLRDLRGRPRLDDPVVVAVLSVAASVLVLVPLGGAVATVACGVAGGALVLLAGHALRLALIAPSAPHTGPVARIEGWAWTIALSLTVPVLGVFVLAVGPTGIDRTGWAVLLGGVGLGAAVLTWARHGRPGPRPGSPRPPAPGSSSRGALGFAGAMVTVAIAGAALWTGVASAVAVPQPDFTQLHLVPRATGAGAATADPSSTAVVGVQSFEAFPHRYRLELQSGTGVPLRTWVFGLDPGQRWEESVRWPGPTRALLYRDAEPTPYRQVWSAQP